MRICLTCSSGGHLLQILQLKRVYKKYPHFFMTFKRDMTNDLSKTEKVYFVRDPERKLLDIFLNFFQSFRIFLLEKPNIVISTGAGVSIPICFIAKLFMKKVIFIESFSRVFRPSLSGRFAYLVSDLFIVQWEYLLKFYKKAKYGGSIF
jgi:UDP-N-acetylglucosamine:LPS N-acetylglucosamine transferase